MGYSFALKVDRDHMYETEFKAFFQNPGVGVVNTVFQRRNRFDALRYPRFPIGKFSARPAVRMLPKMSSTTARSEGRRQAKIRQANGTHFACGNAARHDNARVAER